MFQSTNSYFIIILNFLFFSNLFADIFKFVKCHLFNKNSRKATENVCEQWEITESNNWIRLLIFDDKSWFLFYQPFPKQLISLP